MQVDGKSSVERRIAGAFKAAADATGTSFDFLLKTSERESDHRPELGSDTSSAKGLFQFLDQTWLEVIRREGPSVGLEKLSEKIVSDGKGGLTVEDPKERTKILALRTDPLVSSVMAGKITRYNADRLTETLGREPTDGELYTAHVLGVAGANKLFRLVANEPQTTAAVAFPRAAAANSGLFYERGGRARTVDELYRRLTRMPDGSDPTTARIAAVHESLQAGSSRTDPATVALLLRAQAAAVVGTEKPGGALAPGAAPDAADRTLLKTSLSETAIPGSGDVEQAGRLDGWRSRVARDAFAGLVRDDARSEQADAAFAAAAALPGVAAMPAARVALAAARTGNEAAGPGGIARVDWAAPMSLVPTAPQSPSVAALERAVGERPSRYGAVGGATSDAPLPMVDAGSGETRPSRLLFENWTKPSAEALAAGVIRVRTSSITPPAAPAATEGQGTPDSDGTVPAVPTAETAAPGRRAGTRGNRLPPLDLVALSRTGSVPVASATGRPDEE